MVGGLALCRTGQTKRIWGKLPFVEVVIEARAVQPNARPERGDWPCLAQDVGAGGGWRREKLEAGAVLGERKFMELALQGELGQQVRNREANFHSPVRLKDCGNLAKAELGLW